MTTQSNSDKKEDEVDLDEVLDKFSIFSPYHGLCLVLFFLANATNCAYNVYYVFAMEEVGYRCNDTQVGINDTCAGNCTKWIYYNPNTFVAEFDLACQDWKRTLIGTAHGVGYMVGLLIIGPMSDKIGRKSVAILTGIAGVVLGLARSFVVWYWLFIALEFLEGCIGDTYSPVFMLGIEMVSTKKRVPYSLICNTGYALGGMATALIAWLFPYWRNFMRALYAPGIFFLLYVCLVYESPRWLLTKQETKKAKTVILQVAKKNKVDIKENDLNNLSYTKDEEVSFKKSLKSTFGSLTLIKRLFVCMVWWITCTFVDYGIVINSVSLQGNKYLNFALLFLIELPLAFLTIYILKCISKKLSLTLSFILAAVVCIVQPFIASSLHTLSLILYLAGKFMSAYFFIITYIYTSELFPTYTRNSMHALCSSVGRIGSIVAPQTPLLKKYWDGLPSLIFGGMALVAGVLTFLVPNTSNDALPDTVKEAEALGNRDIPKNNKTKDMQVGEINYFSEHL